METRKQHFFGEKRFVWIRNKGKTSEENIQKISSRNQMNKKTHEAIGKIWFNQWHTYATHIEHHNATATVKCEIVLNWIEYWLLCAVHNKMLTAFTENSARYFRFLFNCIFRRFLFAPSLSFFPFRFCLNEQKLWLQFESIFLSFILPKKQQQQKYKRKKIK